MSEESKRLVAILFADIAGFTKLSSELDPEDVREVANICFSTLDSIIIKHGGIIDKHEGDLIMSLFGVDKVREDDAERACKASVEMLSAMNNINEEISKFLGKKVNIGLHIGINIGEVVFGKVGSTFKEEYTVMGDAVNIASRLCDVAKENEIIVSTEIRNLSHHLFVYEKFSPLNLEGISSPVIAYKLLGFRKKPFPKRGIVGLQSPLVGRFDELNLLKELAIKNKVILLVGDAGIGKTRLALELKNFLNAKFFYGSSNAYSESLPFTPFKEIIKNIYQIRDDEPKEKAINKIVNLSNSLFTEPDDVIPYIANFLSLPFLEDKVKYLDPQDLQLQTFISIRLLFNKIGGVYVIDDYHWIDSASIDLINFLLSGDNKFSLLILTRPDEKIRKIKEGVFEIKLNPLDSSSSEELLRNLLKVPKISKDLMLSILDKSSGNPFFLEEILKTLIDKDILYFSGGVWRNKSKYGIDLPTSIHSIILSRFDLLSPENKKILQIASVIGQDFSFDILEIVYVDKSLFSDEKFIKKTELFEHLNDLEELGFINSKENKYSFTHPLIREVVYNTLLKKIKYELHKKVGDAIEELYKDKLHNFYEQLSYHYYLGREWEKCFDYSLGGAKKLSHSYYNIEAVKLYDRSLNCLEQFAKNKELETKKMEILLEKYEILLHIGETIEAIKILELAWEIANKHQAEESMLKCLLIMTQFYFFRDQYENAKEKLLSASKLLKKVRNKIYEVRYLRLLGLEFDAFGNFYASIDYFSQALELAKEIDVKDEQLLILNSIGGIYQKIGKCDEAINYWKMGIKMSRELKNKKMESTILRNLGAIYSYKGETKIAIKMLEKSLKIRKEIGYKRGEAFTYLGLGSVYLDLGEYDNALKFLKKSIEIEEAIGEKISIIWAKQNICIIYYNLGNFSLAEKVANEVIELCEKLKLEYEKIVPFLILGKINLYKGDCLTAKNYFNLARSLSLAHGLKQWLIEVEISLFDLYLKENNFFDAKNYLDLAEKISKELNLPPYEALLIYNKGKLNLFENNLKEAKENLFSAIKLYKKYGYKFNLACCYYYLSKLLKKLNEKNSNYYFNLAKNLFNKIGVKYWEDRF